MDYNIIRKNGVYWLTAVDTCLCYMRKAGKGTKDTSLKEVVAVGVYRHCLCHCMHYDFSVMRGFRWRADHWVIAVSEVQTSVDYTHVYRTLCSYSWLSGCIKWVSAISYPPRVLKCSCKELTNLLTERYVVQCAKTRRKKVRSMEGLKMWFEQDQRWHTITDCGR